ncbi:hypothetical protein E2986_10948 [Frieseomelitta varia]|uniref:Uncharacterized protein n=1 Tax=Frieseomelitta varia TaxID=561572 RepID=A0A833S0X2_9HYME|nr:hypothetical protein E2986_10948 [Frieseomelitta varia]
MVCMSAVSASKSIRVFVHSTVADRACERKPRGDENVKNYSDLNILQEICVKHIIIVEGIKLGHYEKYGRKKQDSFINTPVTFLRRNNNTPVTMEIISIDYTKYKCLAAILTRRSAYFTTLYFLYHREIPDFVLWKVRIGRVCPTRTRAVGNVWLQSCSATEINTECDGKFNAPTQKSA